jgi:type I restriction enzyme, S subunit
MPTAIAWPMKRLKDITSKIGSGATPRGGKNDYKSAGISLIRSLNVYEFSFSAADLAFIDEAQAAELDNVTVQKNDILLNITGASVARCCMVSPKCLPARVNQHVSIVRVRPELSDARFVLYCINSPHLKNQLLALAQGGATREALTKSTIECFEVPQPELPLQRRIAGILSAYDDLIENNLRRIRILEEMARSIYREWFVNFRFPGYEKASLVESPIGPIPKGWEVTILGELYDTSSGGTPSRRHPEYFEGGSVDWVKSQELLDTFILSTEEQITERALENSSAKLFPANTVLIALYGATIGKLDILTEKAATNQACCAILQKRSAFGKEFAFLTLLLNRDRIIGLRLGAAQQNISQVLLRNFETLRPADDLVTTFSRRAAPLFDGILTFQRQIQNLRQTRDLLLPRLLSGNLNVSDADSPDSLSSDAGKPVVPVEETQERSDGIVLSTEKSALHKESTQEHLDNQFELGFEAPQPIDQTDRSDVLAVIRQVFSDGQPRSRQNAIRDVGRALGYGRVGNRIQDILHADLNNCRSSWHRAKCGR